MHDGGSNSRSNKGGEKKMKLFIFGLLIGLFIGTMTGIVLMALMVAASNEDRRRENEERNG